VRVLLLFTHGISLNDWHDTGIINREIRFYKKLNERYGFSFIFFTYGDSKDFKFAEKYKWLTIVPIYHYIPKFNSNLKNILYDIPLKEARDLFEKEYFEHHLKKNLSISEISKIADIERTHLYRKLKQLGIKTK